MDSNEQTKETLIRGDSRLEAVMKYSLMLSGRREWAGSVCAGFSHIPHHKIKFITSQIYVHVGTNGDRKLVVGKGYLFKFKERVPL